jgi:uncharacterized phosphosugar-binding protein
MSAPVPGSAPLTVPLAVIDVTTYASVALPHLESAVTRNREVMERLVARLVADVQSGKSLLVFGSGHSGIFPMELYHRAGGASFVLPLFADYLLPTAGPPVVRLLERTPGAATVLLNRALPQPGEMLWLCSQSGINASVVDLALEAKKRGLFTVAFTSRAHSSAVASRHSSGKRLFEVCDETVDLGGAVGDAAIRVADADGGVQAGPLSSLGAILLGNSILVSAMAKLEQAGHRCVYTSVNTPEGEARNKKMEEWAARRDVLLR